MKTTSTFWTILLVIVALICAGGGYAMGHIFAPKSYTVGENTETIIETDKSATELTLAQAEAEALKAKVARLEKELAAAKAEAEAEPEEEIAEVAQEPPRRMSRKEHDEQLKREDPERYAEMMKRRQEFHARMEEALAKRDTVLEAIDLSLLTPEQQETHARFVEALAAQQAAMDRMNAFMDSGERPSVEERQAFREAMENVRNLVDEERDALLSAVGVSMGLRNGEETDTFVNVVREVFDSTGMMPPMRMGMGAPAPRR